MNLPAPINGDETGNFRLLWQDGERALYRGQLQMSTSESRSVLMLSDKAACPTWFSLSRLAHEYSLREILDASWALQPLEIKKDGDRTVLILDDPGGQPLENLLGAPMEIGLFLRLAIGVARALSGVHQRGLIHKDIKPAHIMVNCADGRLRLTGFGIASRLVREQRQAAEPPETIAGSLAYISPEQTGRMNRSVDTRTDLYSLGITFYRMLTGSLPFAASGPMEWLHCHIAKQPIAPSERSGTVPAQLANMVMKLLAKMAEERYQTATGLETDLHRCLAEWETHGSIDDFPLGRQDTPERLFIPEKLYGRERDIEILVTSFNRVVRRGSPELVLVSGYSGVGKSSFVNELHKVIVPPRALFASGKFDQYKRDVPYATLAQAFQSLVRSLLSESGSELHNWRDALMEALGPNARLMLDLVPELKLIIGDQPPVPELPPQEAQRRFQSVFLRFIDVLAQPQHPLALFLDDLQWLDAATLDLLKDLLTRSELKHLLLIGAYRDNEVSADHPLRRQIDAINADGGTVTEMVLTPLVREDLGELIADLLRCEPEHVASLTELIHRKTEGNPFFAIQFMSTLNEEGLLAYDHNAARWSWDLDRIHAKGYSDNVLDLMVGKLTRLPAETLHAMQLLACLGNSAESTTLWTVIGKSEEEGHALLWPAVHQELVYRLTDAYRFAHDRVQEAAYSLLAEELRPRAHLRIGRILWAHLSTEKCEEAIFDVVNQLNRGVPLLDSAEERERLAELNLLAAKRAKAANAYASALQYLARGASLLPADSGKRRHELSFALELNRAECEFLTGKPIEAERLLTTLSSHAADTVEKAKLTCLRIDVCTAIDQLDRAIAIGLEYLRHDGIEWSPHPTDEDVRREYQQIWSILGGRKIEDIIDIPLLSDVETLATLDVLNRLTAAAVFMDSNLFAVITCRAVSLSLERGNCETSCSVYARFCRIAGQRFGDYQVGFRFGLLSHRLFEHRGFKRQQGYNFILAIYVMGWMRHVRSSHQLVRRAFEIASNNADITYAAYCRAILNSVLLFAGEPLSDTQREVEYGVAFTQRARFGLVTDMISPQAALVLALRGLVPKFSCLNAVQIDEHQFETHLANNPALAMPECWYWIRKLQAQYLAGEYPAALEAASKAQQLLWVTASFLEEAEYHYYAALTHAVSYDAARAEKSQVHRDALVIHQRRYEVWASNCPENFENRAKLIDAEIAGIDGRYFDAIRLYEQSINSAQANGFSHNEAIASELAGRFCAARGLEGMARGYLRNARKCYLRWGADGKVRQLDHLNPWLRAEASVASPSDTIAAPAGQLDLETVIRVSQAVSGEIDVDKLIDTIMRTAIEQAGAGRGLLILGHAAEQRIWAEAATTGETITVRLRDIPPDSTVLPQAVLRYVLRTQNTLLLDDASADQSFSTDPYVRQHQARSILCLPLINRAKLVGALYLENQLASRVFTEAQAGLKVLASQAATALENTQLYRDLADREARIRRLVDANIIGIFVWSLDGVILEANDAFLKMVGYDREDLAARRVSWRDLTAAEWRNLIPQEEAEVKATRTLQPLEGLRPLMTQETPASPLSST
jgi:predicted ATPase/GAF domain-containing protein